MLSAGRRDLEKAIRFITEGGMFKQIEEIRK